MTDNRFTAVVVDDEAAMLDIVCFALETQDFSTRGFRAALPAWHALQSSLPDLVVLDRMLPDLSGMEMCRRIKARWDVPVMLVTAKSDVGDRIAGLEAEADDYIGKPFHPRELALRARRLVGGRRGPERTGPLGAGRLVLDPLALEVVADGTRVPLTANETRLLTALLSHPGEILEHGHLLAVAWDEHDRHRGREMLKAAVYRLRHKLDQAAPGVGSMIESARGRGYVLRPDR